MFRLPTLAVASFLILGAVGVAPQVHGGTSPGDNIVFKGPVFRYFLREDHDPVVCRHMLHVFNEKFVHPWDEPELTDSTYSADSKYAFPLLSGVQHSTQTTFDMKYSAWPTSPEFSAIHWSEGRVTPGGCPIGKTCPGEELEPSLIGYFDFDNDGSVDTVIKHGTEFFPSYARMSWAQEDLTIWRGQKLKIAGVANMWDLSHQADKRLTPINMWGTYLRPFIYNGITYVASYEPSFSEAASNSLNRYMPPYPIREDMLVNKYSFTGQMQAVTGRPQWTTNTVCDLGMKRLKN